MLNKNLNLILLISAMVALAVLSRLVSHAWNFTILGGLALFSGLFFARKSVAFAVIFLSLLISDAMIGFHSQMPSVYFSFLLMVVLGSFLNLRSSRGIVIGTSLLGSLLFFFITNFFVWYGGSLYPQTVQGLIQCYVMGEPFFRAQIISDILSMVIFVEVAKAMQKQIVTHFDQYQVLPGHSL